MVKVRLARDVLQGRYDFIKHDMTMISHLV
jgi:hypothetical protein